NRFDQGGSAVEDRDPLLVPEQHAAGLIDIDADDILEFGSLVADVPPTERVRRLRRRTHVESIDDRVVVERLRRLGRCGEPLADALQVVERAGRAICLDEGHGGCERRANGPYRSGVLHGYAAEALERLVIPPYQLQRVAGIEPGCPDGFRSREQTRNALEAGQRRFDVRWRTSLRHRQAS